MFLGIQVTKFTSTVSTIASINLSLSIIFLLVLIPQVLFIKYHVNWYKVVLWKTLTNLRWEQWAHARWVFFSQHDLFCIQWPTMIQILDHLIKKHKSLPFLSNIIILLIWCNSYMIQYWQFKTFSNSSKALQFV